MSAFRNFAVTLLLSLVIFGLIAFGAVKFATKAIKNSADGQNVRPSDESQEADTDDDTGGTVNPEPITVSGKSFTILFAVTDYRPDVYTDYEVQPTDLREDGFPVEPRKVHTDIILLVRMQKELGECVVCAIPSNIKITIDGLPAKLRDLYAAKGADELRNKVMSLTGLAVDYYAVADYDGYKKVIDKFGPVSFSVSKDVSFRDDATGGDFLLRKGTQKLDGTNAMNLLTYDGYGDGGVQMRKYNVNFLKEICKIAITADNKPNAHVLYNTFISDVKTNFTIEKLDEQMELVFSFPKMAFTEYKYPGSVSGSGDSEYFVPSTEKVKEFFDAYKFKG